jgi:hypothetical protein
VVSEIEDSSMLVLECAAKSAIGDPIEYHQRLWFLYSRRRDRGGVRRHDNHNMAFGSVTVVLEFQAVTSFGAHRNKVGV